MGNRELTKNKIILAAIEEFSNNGYDCAVTKSIATAAGVSKGVIFLHFENKERLFLNCVEHIIAVYKEEIKSLDVYSNADIFEKLVAFVDWKYKCFRNSSKMAKFFTVCFTLKNSELKEKAVNLINAFALPLKKAIFTFDFDPNIYKENITKEKVLNMLALILSGFEHKYSDAYETLPDDRIFLEWNSLGRFI
ncbi:TetR family transcriptional regulator, partial [bacterium]|nr:TetR family transcriptional regulator [bacterium]